MVKFIFLSILAVSVFSFADEPTQETQKLLKNKKARDSAIATDSKAANADNLAKQVGGSEANTEAIYDLAAELLPILTAEAGGDPDKMQELLGQYQRDPAAFANKLSPEQKKKLKALSEKIEAGKNSKP